jgi:hypothetical protein
VWVQFYAVDLLDREAPQLSSREEAYQTFHDVQQLLKLILNIVGGESDEA